jgi:hypothetical protein
MKNQTVMADFNVHFWRLPGVSDENHDSIAEYESEMLTTTPLGVTKDK